MTPCARIMFEEAALLPAGGDIAGAVRLVVFDFDGVFTDNTVWSDDSGNEWVRCWRSDGLGLSKLKALSIPVWVLSTEVHPVVSRRCAKLGIPCRQGLAAKHNALRDLAKEIALPLSDTVYVGNDINDDECLRMVGIPIVVADAHPDVLPFARFRTRRPGGLGAVREVCDWIHAGHLAHGRTPS